MKLTNDTYLILISSARSGKTESYYDKQGRLAQGVDARAEIPDDGRAGNQPHCLRWLVSARCGPEKP
jgi:hypothetical protein